MGSEHRAMEQDDGFCVFVRGVTEIVNVAIWAETTDDGGAGWSVNGLALGADGDFAVVPNADAGLLAPDVGPPRTVGIGAQDGSFFGAGLLLGGVGCLAEFAVDFVLVGVGQELIEQRVGPGEFDDLIGGQEGDEAFLPVVVAAFDFTFGLGRWGIEQLNAVEVERGAELGEGVGGVGVEEGVEVHIQGQRQAVGLEDAGKKIEVGQEGFAWVEACAGVAAGGVVEDVQQGLLVGAAGQPGVRAGIVLPEGAAVAGLPAFDGLGSRFVTGVGVELMFAGPAADAGAVGFEVETTRGFAGGGAVGGGRLGGEEFGEQGGDCRGPIRLVIPAGETGRPSVGAALSAGQQVVGAELVVAADAEAQFEGERVGREQAGAGLGEEMADQWRGEAMGELEFFIAGRMEEEEGFNALKLTPAEPAGPRPRRSPACRSSGFRRRSDCVPAEPYPPLKRRPRAPQRGNSSSET